MQFSYQVRDRQGAAISGTLEAADSGAAASLLAKSGMVPVRIQALQARTSPSAVADERSRASSRIAVPPETLMNFCRQMHTMMRAGVPIMRALAALCESGAHRGFSTVLMDLRQQLESGRELSAAMQAHPAVFDAFFRSMVRIGETTGRIDKVFIRMLGYLEFEKEMNQRVKTATRYPSFVVMAIAAAMVIINVFVIPSFAGVYKSFHAELPVVTRVLIASSDLTLHYWPLLIAAVAAAIFAYRAWVRTPSGRYLRDAGMLRMPVIGPLLRKAVLARFARSLALALNAGVPVTDALAAAAQTTDNHFVRRRLVGMRTAIDRGESVSQAARRAEVFTPVVLQMIAIGEESGTIDELLDEVALTYEGDVAYELKTLSDHIEPLLIVVLGGLVLILALGVFLPMWDLGHAALGGPAR